MIELVNQSVKISGMHCASCAKRIEMAVSDVPGASIKVDLSSKSATLSAPDPAAMRKALAAIQAEGYGVQ